MDRGDRSEGTAAEGVSPDEFREAFSHWASGVTVVAARDPDDDRVYATTVSSLASVSAEPPIVSFALGPGAQVLPFLPEGRRFAVNVLAAGQDELATRFTDSFPVGTTPFAAEGEPMIEGSLLRLTCTVLGKVPVRSSRIIVARVDGADVAADEGEPLLYYRRDYRRLDGGG
jgi:flavin reductase (DIM6/NTAB) family NADH-FMN oxidoreductase RutF